MNIYLVEGKLPGQGEYVPEDPVTSGGGYYGNKYFTHFITAETAAAAREAVVMACRGNAKSVTVKKMCSATKKGAKK